MQSERWRTCTELFHAALGRAPRERAAFLEESCAGDESLRRKVEVLLRYHEKSADFIAAPAFETSPELLAGDREALLGKELGHYRIESILGVGGMGVVYLAQDMRLGRKVGLKLLPPSLVADAAQLERLKHEARTASALNHPNIVTIHEIGEADGVAYIATEFVEGATLRERIVSGPIPPNEAVEIAIQVGSALCVAHRAGIVHRDIKPENIMLRPDGYVKVLDFGIAKTRHADGVGVAVETDWKTEAPAGKIFGTAQYLSPEQARGDALDARSDLWSLGILLYEMLAGIAPFRGETPEDVKRAVLNFEPTPLTGRGKVIALIWQSVIAKGLRKNRSDRFRNAEEMLAALRTCRLKHRPRITRARFLVGAGTVLLAAGVVAVFMGTRDRGVATAPPNVGLMGDAQGSVASIRPAGIAVDSSGTIYVADFAQHAIRQTSAAGTMTVLAGTPGSAGHAPGRGSLARFHHPGAVAVGPDGTIYVADTDNHLIRKITREGLVTSLAGQPGKPGHQDGPISSATFNYPTGVAADRTGNIYVADFSNHLVRKINPAGVVSTLAGSAGEPGHADGLGADARFKQVHGLAVDGAGQVYAADFGNHTIRKITPEGLVTTLAGLAEQPGSADGVGASARFSASYGVTADDVGNVYVADTSNHTIRKITPDGTATTLAGLAGNVGSTDGAGREALFAVPTGVASDHAGNIYVADFGNHAIRKITPAGVVSTLGGLSGDHSVPRDGAGQ
ncbi:MAG: protein kinase domain-containing protein [Chthoniobacterales bacterium]